MFTTPLKALLRNAKIFWPVYEECKQKAAESSKHLEIFGIWNKNKCVTTKTGKSNEYFNKDPDSSNCKTCEGKGIGSKKRAVFVYKT